MMFYGNRSMSMITSATYALLILVLKLGLSSCEGSATFGFDIHHRFSGPVKAMFNNMDIDLPDVGTIDYYNTMIHRDRFFHGRRLAGEPLTFIDGNTTLRINSLGFLYYANVSVGTPESWYLVALDTGSHLFWLPCDCAPNCVNGIRFSSTETLQFNIYSPKASSTAAQLSCTSPLCQTQLSCSTSQISCPYKVAYLSENTSSSGYLVQDVLHLTTSSNPSSATNARITFGCGVKQTGVFLETAAPNGLLGLTMDDISLPSILASQNVTANSFSMCFSEDGVGRINFGDKGSSDQHEAPLNSDELNLYNISITEVAVGNNKSSASFTAIFDSGTSFTLLSDPAYTLISEKFHSQIKDKREDSIPNNPFEYCYETTSSLSDLVVPSINLTLSGGERFSVIYPSIQIALQNGMYIYCLAVVKSDEVDINIIGENFMSGYHIVFDHEKKVLGWKESDCDEAVARVPDIPRTSTNTLNRSGASPVFGNSMLINIILLVQILSLQLIFL